VKADKHSNLRGVAGRRVDGTLPATSMLVLAIALAMAFGTTLASAQTLKEFDVAVIRPNRSGEQNTGRNVTVRTLVLYGFDIKDFQLVSLPAWCNSERFDIEAKAGVPGTIDPEELRPLLRALLESRLQLRFYRNTKELPLYSLVVVKNGPKLHPNTGTPGHSTDWGNDHVNATAVSVTEFGRVLEAQLDRVVVDDTGIPGAFDFHLTWTPDQKADTSGPSLFTAIQEQYGLRLESKKGPVGVVVVDRIERPTEN